MTAKIPKAQKLFLRALKEKLSNSNPENTNSTCCPICLGKGYIRGLMCHRCGGTGRSGGMV